MIGPSDSAVKDFYPGQARNAGYQRAGESGSLDVAGATSSGSNSTDPGATLNRTQAHNPESEGQQQDQSKQNNALQALAARDRAVRAHEAAHKAAGGALTGPIRFEYQSGPDGKRYAVGGEVSIDTSEVAGDPNATLLKANRIRSAALAPVDPSAQDRAVAAQAVQMATEARREILQPQSTPSSENNARQSDERPPDGDGGAGNKQASSSSLTTVTAAKASASQDHSAPSVNRSVNRLLENTGDFLNKQNDPQLSIFV